MKRPPTKGSFKKGQSGNPSGRFKDKELQELRRLSTAEFTKSINKFFYLTQDQLKEEIKKPELPMIDLLVGTMLARAVKDQDPQRAQFLLDRSIGKVKDVVEMNSVQLNFSMMPRERVIEMGQEAIKFLQEAKEQEP
jgi:hypothetical protein